MEHCVWIIDDECPEHAIERDVLAALPGGVRFVRSMLATYRHDLASYGPVADAVLTQGRVVADAAFLAGLARCQVLSNYAVGYNNIDVAAAKAKGITVCNVPGYCAEDMADYIVSAISHLNRPITGFLPAIRAGRWGFRAIDGWAPRRLREQTLFLVGFGHIGRRVAEKTGALGMRVLAYSPHLTPEKATAAGARCVTLDDGLAAADYVSLSLPLNAQTEHFADAAFLAKMKETACLINTSRGGILDTAALLAAVRAKRLRAAVLDVLPDEPPKPDDPVLSQPGIYVTPHISWYSRDAYAELQRRAAENVLHVLKGEAGADIVTA